MMVSFCGRGKCYAFLSFACNESPVKQFAATPLGRALELSSYNSLRLLHLGNTGRWLRPDNTRRNCAGGGATVRVGDPESVYQS
jgi:hypothetical protein